MTTEAKHPVRTTETTLSIVEALNELGSAGVTELGEHTGIGKSAVHNHLTTLMEHGYVVKHDQEYRLALKFLEIGGQARHRHQLYRAAKSTVEKQEIETEGLFRLLTHEDGRGVVIYQSKRSQVVSEHVHLGNRPYLHTTGGGKAILAALPRGRTEAILERWGLPAVTEKTVTARERLFDELNQAQESGYATAIEEWFDGIRSTGTPITAEDGTVLGALSIVQPMPEGGSISLDGLDTEEHLQRMAETIETDIEYAWYEPNKFIKMKHR